MVENVLDWLADAYRHPERRPLTELQLSRGRSLVLDIGRDLPAHAVSLSPQRFTELRAALDLSGLPPDLFYPLRQRRMIVEPTTDDKGRVSTIRQTYSPLQWQRRDPTTRDELVLPGDTERRTAFIAASEAFLDELHFRELVTLQRTKQYDAREVRIVRDLELHVQDVIDRTAGRRVASFQRKPNAGWKESPSAWQALESVWSALGRLHSRGGIAGMYGLGPRPDTWHIWLVEGNSHLRYEIGDGVLYGPTMGTPTAPPMADPTVLFRLPSKGWRGLLDSDAAVRVAEEAGAARFRKAGGQLRGLFLHRAQGRWIWQVACEIWGTPYKRDLRIDIDIRTSKILRQETRRSLWLG
jgi:hypothetical protein